MSQSQFSPNPRARRRSVAQRQRQGSGPLEETDSTRRTPTPAALAVVAVLLALVLAAGLGLGAAVKTRPYGAFANCHPAARLDASRFASVPPTCTRADRTYVAKLNTTRGKVDFVMPAKNAPATVNNFIVLAANGFYDGLNFHRTESWVVQGGDPLGTGRGGPGYSLPAEPSTQAWGTGSVGMARFPGGPINGSQFFIVRGPWPGGGPGDVTYNQFATVLAGVEVVNGLTQEDRILSVDLSIQS